jgi:protoheme IX farnesyltransferase
MVPGQALRFGLVLAVVSTAILHWCGGLLAAAVGAISILFYVFVYTLGLKRRTPQNIVIGGAAGATAPLIADAAVDGHLGLASLVLFTIIFLWTPPHFWAIALFRKDEYAAAEIPMMPLVVGDQGTRWRSLGYTLLMVPVTLILPWLGYVHLPYTVIAVAAGAWFTWWNIKAIRAQDYAVDKRMFHVSIAYLFALFGAMMLDLLLYQILGVL